MRTPKNVRRADAKKNAVLDEKRSEKVIGDITILASQIRWGDNTTTRIIDVYHTGAVRQPWEDGYEQDIESHEFKNANDANRKFFELIRKYSK